jgi:hypothetical protein
MATSNEDGPFLVFGVTPYVFVFVVVSVVEPH